MTPTTTSIFLEPPDVVCIDVETACNGQASLDYWRPDFRILSMAATWRDGDGRLQSRYFSGEDEPLHFLRALAARAVRIVVHNLSFEMGVILCRYPGLQLHWYVDTMRLSQVYDNGADAFIPRLPASLDDQLDALDSDEDGDADLAYIGGLSLANCVQRILGRPDHKAEAYGWLRAAGVKKGREGASLHLLPPDLLARYNTADTEETLRLYEFLVAHFKKIHYDWRLDHQLYMSSVRYIVRAQAKGVLVDRVALDHYRRQVEAEIAAISAAFHERFRDEIAAVERQRLLVRIRKLKTLRGRCGFVRRYRAGTKSALKPIKFNTGSTVHLGSLFIDQLGVQPRFFTAKGLPSFKAAVLESWGEGGVILKNRRKRQLILQQASALLELSAMDGRWHMGLKVCGTKTGRCAGGTV